MTDPIPPKLPREAGPSLREELEAFREKTPAERGRLLAIACRAAARLDRSRQQAGLPAPSPDPWPASTWTFLKQQARHARH